MQKGYKVQNIEKLIVFKIYTHILDRYNWPIQYCGTKYFFKLEILYISSSKTEGEELNVEEAKNVKYWDLR